LVNRHRPGKDQTAYRAGKVSSAAT
jgi:hypothetical protein